jgi:hypothetical protein
MSMPIGGSAGNFSPSFDVSSKGLEQRVNQEKNNFMESMRDLSSEKEVDQAQGQKSALNQTSAGDSKQDLDNKLKFASLSAASLPMTSARTMGTNNIVV